MRLTSHGFGYKRIKDFKMSDAYTFQLQINFLLFLSTHLSSLRTPFASFFRLSFFRPTAPNNWSTTSTLSPAEGALLFQTLLHLTRSNMPAISCYLHVFNNQSSFLTSQRSLVIPFLVPDSL